MAASKVLISLPPGLCREADEFAHQHGMTRSELMRRNNIWRLSIDWN